MKMKDRVIEDNFIFEKTSARNPREHCTEIKIYIMYPIHEIWTELAIFAKTAVYAFYFRFHAPY